MQKKVMEVIVGTYFQVAALAKNQLKRQEEILIYS